MPHTQLSASGLDVGLPDGQMGNSEVGHTNIGARPRGLSGRCRASPSAIEDGAFFENPGATTPRWTTAGKGHGAAPVSACSPTAAYTPTIEHLWALLKMARHQGPQAASTCTASSTGATSPPTSGADFVAEAQKKCAELGVGKIATVMGRYYAMDRDKRWDRR